MTTGSFGAPAPTAPKAVQKILADMAKANIPRIGGVGVGGGSSDDGGEEGDGSNEEGSVDGDADSGDAACGKAGGDDGDDLAAAEAALLAGIHASTDPLLRRYMCVRFMQHMFQRRPVWSKSELIRETREWGQHTMNDCEHIVAYKATNGPWRQFWIRYGYTPHADPQARFLQALDVRVTSAILNEWYRLFGLPPPPLPKKKSPGAADDCDDDGANEDGDDGGADDGAGDDGGAGGGCGVGGGREVEDEAVGVGMRRRGSILWAFQRPIARQMRIPMRCLAPRALQMTVLRAPRVDKPSQTHGWFSAETVKQLRGAVIRHVQDQAEAYARTHHADAAGAGAGVVSTLLAPARSIAGGGVGGPAAAAGDAPLSEEEFMRLAAEMGPKATIILAAALPIPRHGKGQAGGPNPSAASAASAANPAAGAGTGA
ncbi:unnamed protein product, partial [Phaeothamnion confervicola]